MHARGRLLPLVLLGLSATAAGLAGCDKEVPQRADEPEGPRAPPLLSFSYDTTLNRGTLLIRSNGDYMFPKKGTEVRLDLRQLPDEDMATLSGSMKIHSGSYDLFPATVSFEGQELVTQTSNREDVDGSILLTQGPEGVHVAEWFPDLGILELEGRLRGQLSFATQLYETATFDLELPTTPLYVRSWILNALADGGFTLPDEQADTEGKGALLFYTCGGHQDDGLYGEARTLAEIDRIAVGTCRDTNKRSRCRFDGAKLEMIHQEGVVEILDRRTGEVLDKRIFPPRTRCPSSAYVQRGQKTLGSGISREPLRKWVASKTGYARVKEQIESPEP